MIGFDHVVLRVADVERSVGFYHGLLGLEPVRLDEWRRGEVPFASVRVDEGCIIDLLEAEADGTNVDHVCLVLAPDTDLDDLVASGRFDVVAGPRPVFGARGVGRGVYVRDPDGHVIELRHY